jgi:hypothetical protein
VADAHKAFKGQKNERLQKNSAVIMNSISMLLRSEGMEMLNLSNAFDSKKRALCS